MSVYVLIAIMRKRLGISSDLYRMLQILSVMPFEQIALKQALGPRKTETDPARSATN